MTVPAAERAETLAQLELVAFRRLGANRVHFALVMPEAIGAGSVFGAPCQVIAGPVVAWCGKTLRGSKVVIPDGKLDSWKRNGHVCRECVLLARVALAQARVNG